MKKFLISLALVVAVALGATARDSYTHDASVLPEAATTTIANNYKAKVSLVKVDKKLGRVDDYEVILTDGSEITFDRQGNWKDVEATRNGSVPSYFVPKGVSDYVAKTHNGMKIVGIEKERNGYEVELSNGIDIKFDRNGSFVRYDD